MAGSSGFSSSSSSFYFVPLLVEKENTTFPRNMKPEDITSFRKALEEQLASLTKVSGDHQKLLDEAHETQDFVGGDRAAELETMEVDASVAESEFLLQKKIQHALERIDSGTYGVCAACGKEIPRARLEAKPSVSLCLTCQEAHEANG